MFFFDKVKFVIIFTTLTLINLNSAANSDKAQDAKCLLPVEPGPCHMNLNRFYYNAQTDTCEEFKFGGCKGNENKFGFKQTCEAACKKSTGAASKQAATSATSSKTEIMPGTSKQLKADTVKVVNGNVATTSTTTSKPGAARTTVKTLTSSTSKGAKTIAEKSK